ncbi:GNAT family N-acetyltransferase [Neotamlana laminarinivorans]|uniref:GNAT family N-acetyltransferase n=1 Tax=Neotamlana laminarinivorans TaxID=2883124 RepID=A0A9X1HXP5_9FLAO|nr:GNAT family N-acetyltransferase [Tamlana laminarinivorans]MCB4798068.1 GNAT family N-acetyltransferase [Tamlana laminarinivorans]
MVFRKATLQDLPAIIALYANDKLGKTREQFVIPLPKQYVEAFKNINEDKNQELIVLENDTNEVIGTLQLTYLQHLNRLGSLRVQIESVHIKTEYQGKGLGKTMFQWAINRAKEKGASIVQLTSDKKRPEAIKFYQKLGFTASHEGLKLQF